MVRASLKRKVMGKAKKQEMLAARKQAVESRKKRDDKRWAKVLAKMSEEKRKNYTCVGNTGEQSRVRGVTRASQRKLTGRRPDNFSIEATVHLSKLLKHATFHKRAPMAIKRIKKFTSRLMKTKDNRIDASLNNFVWHKGVKGVPTRVRILMQRKAEAIEGSKRKHYYTVVSNVPTPSFKGLTTKVVQ